MEHYFCDEGLDAPMGDILLTNIEARIVHTILESIIADDDVSGYGEEAQVVLGSLKTQLAERQ